jgi:hypothetical protein
MRVLRKVFMKMMMKVMMIILTVLALKYKKKTLMKNPLNKEIV